MLNTNTRKLHSAVSTSGLGFLTYFLFSSRLLSSDPNLLYVRKKGGGGHYALTERLKRQKINERQSHSANSKGCHSLLQRTGIPGMLSPQQERTRQPSQPAVCRDEGKGRRRECGGGGGVGGGRITRLMHVRLITPLPAQI